MEKLKIFNFLYDFDGNKKVNLSEALKLLEKTPIPMVINEKEIYAINDDTFIMTKDPDSEDNAVGFMKKNEEIIQFLRLFEDEWEIDIPIQNLQTKSWTGETYLFDGLSTYDVKKIVKVFFKDADLISSIVENFEARDNYNEDDDKFKLEMDVKFKKWVNLLSDR